MKLDDFEVGYDRLVIDVVKIDYKSCAFESTQSPSSLYTQTEEECKAFVYISKNHIYTIPPSEQYLTAIHIMLREQHTTIKSNHRS